MLAAIQERTTRILLVEDNKIDARLTRQAIQKITGWPSALEVVDDGEKAIRFLGRQNPYAAAEKPDLVILDLNLPKCDGTEVLSFIRATEDLRNLLVFIFSSSPVEVAQERMSGVQLEADSYFEKPNEVDTYLFIAEQIRETYRRARVLRSGAVA